MICPINGTECILCHDGECVVGKQAMDGIIRYDSREWFKPGWWRKERSTGRIYRTPNIDFNAEDADKHCPPMIEELGTELPHGMVWVILKEGKLKVYSTAGPISVPPPQLELLVGKNPTIISYEQEVYMNIAFGGGG